MSNKIWLVFKNFLIMLGFLALIAILIYFVKILFIDEAEKQKLLVEEANLKKSLEETYQKITELEKTENYTQLYEYLEPSEKTTVSLNDFIEKSSSRKKTYDQEYIIHNIEIRGNKGIIERTVSFCLTSGCSETERVSNTAKKLYLYIDGRWYFNSDSTLYCDRDTPYNIPEEFKRGISLIIQRLEQTNNPIGFDRVKNIKSIRNCLNIQYAYSDEEMQGAEGVFLFSAASTPENLQIYVSPRYEAKDDLLTAILLSHEIIHAFLYSTGADKTISCFENEAHAFRQQLLFMSTLNEEEIASLTYRYNNRASPEAVGVIDLPLNVRNQSPEGPSQEVAFNKALNYVKNSKFYQDSCAN